MHIYWSEIAKEEVSFLQKVGSFLLKEIVLLHLLWKSRNTSGERKNTTSSLRNLKYFNQLSSWMAGGQKLHHTLIHLISDQVFWHLAVWCISKNIRSLESGGGATLFWSLGPLKGEPYRIQSKCRLNFSLGSHYRTPNTKPSSKKSSRLFSASMYFFLAVTFSEEHKFMSPCFDT